MNQTLDLLYSHRSIRSYTSEIVTDDVLDKIVEAAYRGPTSMNAQEVSLIVVRSTETKTKIAELAGGQPWIAKAPVFIAIIADFHKTSAGLEKNGDKELIHEDAEGLIAATLDSGIVLTNLMIAARALGLGCVPIGGLRRNPQAVIDLLKMPSLTFPICGLTLGHIDQDAPLKPRMPMKSFRFDEAYDESVIVPAIDEYDETLKAFWAEMGRADGLPWSANTAEKYKTIYYPEVSPTLRRQGFLKR